MFSIIKFPNWIINALKRTGGVSFEIYLLFECIIKTVEMIVGSMKTQSIYVAVLYNMVAVIITIIIAIPLKRIGEKVGKQIKILLF